MAGDDDRNRIAAIGGADRAHRGRRADLPGHIAIAAGLAIGNGQQSLPDLLLEAGAGEDIAHLESPPLTLEILAELTPGLDQHRMLRLFGQVAQTNPARIVVFPQNGGEAFAPGHQLETADRRIDPGEKVDHGAQGAGGADACKGPVA